MVTQVPFGFRKLSQEEADSGEFGPRGLRIAKVPELSPVIQNMAKQVLDGDTYEDIARKLNDENVSTGPYAQNSTWSGKRVRQILRNSLLHGERTFGRYQIKRQRTTGKKTRKFNDNPEIMIYTELAHLTPQEHERVLQEMDRRITSHPRKNKGTSTTARSRTLFPGQIVTCSWCDGLFYFAGKGMKCSKCGDPENGGCANHLQLDPEIVRQKIARVILDMIQSCPKAESALLESALQECQKLHHKENRRLEQIDSQIKKLQKELANMAKAIAEGIDLEEVRSRSEDTKERLASLEMERNAIVNDTSRPFQNCNRDNLADAFPALLDYLLKNSYDFNEIMRRVITSFAIIPMQAVDSGKPVGRAQVTFGFNAISSSTNPATYYAA
jgi:hypothetical protein